MAATHRNMGAVPTGLRLKKMRVETIVSIFCLIIIPFYSEAALKIIIFYFKNAKKIIKIMIFQSKKYKLKTYFLSIFSLAFPIHRRFIPFKCCRS